MAVDIDRHGQARNMGGALLDVDSQSGIWVDPDGHVIEGNAALAAEPYQIVEVMAALLHDHRAGGLIVAPVAAHEGVGLMPVAHLLVGLDSAHLADHAAVDQLLQLRAHLRAQRDAHAAGHQVDDLFGSVGFPSFSQRLGIVAEAVQHSLQLLGHLTAG